MPPAKKSRLGPVTLKTKFEPVPFWAKLPMGVTFHGDATSVAVDSKDNVWVFNRGNNPIAIFDKNGNFLRGAGQGDFDRAHGIEIDADDNVYLVDDGGHFVQKRNKSGTVQFTIGSRGKPAAWQSGGIFNRPTDVAVHPKTGEIFVSDGYANSRVHKFDPNGKHMKSWGEPGTDPGQFSLPHNICMAGDDMVAVADRENFRVQLFTTSGEFCAQYHIHHPMSITSGRGGDDCLYIGEMKAPPVQANVPNLGLKVSIITREGKLVNRLGAPTGGSGPDQFVAPHGIAVDSEGSIYVAEVAWTNWYSVMPKPPIGEVVSLRKWKRVSG